MIFANMVIDAKPGRRDELASAMETMLTETRKEAGCIVYTYAADLSDPNRFHLTEMWENEPLMDAHIDTDHAWTFVQLLNEAGKIVSVKAFEAEGRKFRIRAPTPR